MQDLLLITLVLKYSNKIGLASLASFGAYSAIVYAFTSDTFHISVITALLV